MTTSPESYESLFQKARDSTPKSLSDSAWYLLVATTLIATDGGAHLGKLYKYILKELGPNSTQETRKGISRQLRAVVIKAWTLVGVPRASDGMFSLIKEEDPADEAQDWDRHQFAADPSKALLRTKEWWKQVFGEEAATISKSYESMPDFSWTVDFVVYGLYLADLSVLGPIENELVILASVMGQGAYNTTRFHLRGTRRLGINSDDAEGIQSVIEMVAHHQGKDSSSWPRFKEVEHLF